MSHSSNNQSNQQHNQNTTIIGKRYQMREEITVSSKDYSSHTQNWKTYLAEDTGIIGTPLCIVKQIPLSVHNTEEQSHWDELVAIQQQLGEHPDLPRILAYFSENSDLYVIREYLEGETLAQQLANRTFNQKEAIKLLLDLLDVLAFVHTHKVIYGNIQPKNIIQLKHNNKYTLIDFDSIKKITLDEEHLMENKIVTLVINTSSFFAPEQRAEQAIISSDFYSLGKSIIYSLTKNLSPNWEEESQYQHNIKQLHPQFKKILNKMIVPNIQARYHNIAEIQNDLAPIEDVSTIMEANAQKLDYNNDVPLTIINPSHSNNSNNSKIEIKKVKKLPLILGIIGLFALVIMAEFITPTLRPFYYSWQGRKTLETEPEISLNKFQQGIEINDQYTNAWVGRGDALFNLERYRAALLAYDKAINLEGDSASAWVGRGNALFRLERFEAALTAYNKSLQIKPDNPESLNRKGRALYKLERQEEALQAQDKALEIKPNYAQALSDRGIVLIGLGKYDEALKSFEDAQAIEPLNPEFWQNKALAWQYLGRNQEAFRLYQEALESYNNKLQHDPDNVTALIDKGNVLTKLQQHAEAIKAYDEAIKYNSNSHLAWLNKGNAYFALGKYEQALKSFDRALKIAPESYLTWHNRGSLLRDGMQNYQEAIASYQEATKLNPSFYHAWRDLGLTQSQSGQQYLALKSFDTALEINPEDYQSWVGRGIAYSYLNKIEESIAAFDRAAEINPNDPSIWINKGYALEDAQKYQEACQAYIKVAQINPTFSAAIEGIERLNCQQ